MGITTSADEKRDEALDHLNKAYLCILEVINPDTFGGDEYSDDYIEEMERAAITLVGLKRKLG